MARRSKRRRGLGSDLETHEQSVMAARGALRNRIMHAREEIEYSSCASAFHAVINAVRLETEYRTELQNVSAVGGMKRSTAINSLLKRYVNKCIR